MVSDRRGFYAAVAVLAVVLMLAAAMFVVLATPAWSQNDTSEDLAGEPVEEETNADPNDDANDRNITSLTIDADCNVGRNARIVFRDERNNDRFTVVNGDNVQIDDVNDQVVVEDLTDENENDTDVANDASTETDQDIEFIVGTDSGNERDREFEELSNNRELEVVRTSSIDCVADAGTGTETGTGTGTGTGTTSTGTGTSTTGTGTETSTTNTTDTSNSEEEEEEEEEEEGEGEEEGEDGVTQEVVTNGEEQYGDETPTDSLVADDGEENDAGGGANARTANSEANAGGEDGANANTDPDNEDPVTEPQGRVVDEVNTRGAPLPETGGPITVLAPLSGGLLAGIALIPFVLMTLAITGIAAREARRRSRQ